MLRAPPNVNFNRLARGVTLTAGGVDEVRKLAQRVHARLRLTWTTAFGILRTVATARVVPGRLGYARQRFESPSFVLGTLGLSFVYDLCCGQQAREPRLWGLRLLGLRLRCVG
jgi:hypothetical protein